MTSTSSIGGFATLGATLGAAMALVAIGVLAWFLVRRARSERHTRGNDASAQAGTREPPAAAAIAAAASSSDSLPPDRTALGRYRLDRQLGRGAMGTVYLAHDDQLGRAIALKTMALGRDFEGSELAEARTRFFREAEMAGRLRHPDIVSIYDAGEAKGLAYIAMEYVRGHDLLRYTLPGRLLPVPTVLATIERVARALAYAHTQGVVHRDVKPANVMVDPETGAIKVTDFGIARITDARRTRTGLVLGTPSFMSPEQMAGRRVDGRTDLYSLGVMLYQMLTGALPHPSESMSQLMYQIANEPAPDVRLLRPELPEALANIVALALEKRPEMRYADGAEMAADLQLVASTLVTEPASPAASDGVGEPVDSVTFEATVEFSRNDPRHNAQH